MVVETKFNVDDAVQIKELGIRKYIIDSIIVKSQRAEDFTKTPIVDVRYTVAGEPRAMFTEEMLRTYIEITEAV